MSTAIMHPKVLAEMLENAVEYSTHKGGSDFNDTIMAQPHDDALTVMGLSKYAVLRERRPADGLVAQNSLIVDREEVATFCKALRKVDGFARKDTAIHLHVTPECFEVKHGDEDLVKLGPSDRTEEFAGDAEHVGIYEHASELMDQEPRGISGVRLTKEMVQKMTKIKTGLAPSEIDTWQMQAIGPHAMYVSVGHAEVAFVTSGEIVELEEA